MSDHGRAHALLSPSSAERWISCPASVRMVESLGREADESGSVWADEGTRAHKKAEIEASYAFGLSSSDERVVRDAAWRRRSQEAGDDVEAMERHAAEYVALLKDIEADLGGRVTARLEVRVRTGVPGCWGTADAALMGLDRVAVVDYKYGQGVRVNAEKNPQAMLYGVGVLEMLDLLGVIETVDLWIHQPRIASGTSKYTLSAAALREWRDHEVMEAARESQQPDARFGPSDEACRWCPAAGICKPRMAFLTQRDFGNPDLLDPQGLADAVRLIPQMRDWCNAVEKEALYQGYSEGKALPGLKVVMSGGKRRIKDDHAAIERLVAEGYDRALVSRETAQTLGNLEKVVGKERLPLVLGSLLVKGEGSPSLVDESDERPAISPTTEAQRDFRGE